MKDVIRALRGTLLIFSLTRADDGSMLKMLVGFPSPRCHYKVAVDHEIRKCQYTDYVLDGYSHLL